MNSVATIPRRLPGASAVQSAVAEMVALADAACAEITQAKAGVIMHDLSEAVDGIIDKAKEVMDPLAAAEVVVELSIIDPATIFEFVPVKNRPGRYRMISPKLREYINGSMDTRLIEDAMLETPTDTDVQKAARLRLSVQPLELFYMYHSDFLAVTPDDITASDSGLTWAEYKTFFDDFSIRYNEHVTKVQAEAKAKLDAHVAAFNSGVVTFDDLEVGLREETRTRTTYMFRNGDQNVAGKVLQVRRQMSMFGPYLQISMHVYSHNEQGLNKYTHSVMIDSFPETETLANLNVTRLIEGSDDAKKLIERGTKYLELTKKPSYVKSTGNMTRKVGRTVEVLNAQGRVMIDLEGMTNMDTNYHQYFCKAEEDTAVIAFKTVAEVSDEIKLACIPYVYGFSFKAKKWGQLNVADMTPIEFRTDAYEMLVLDQKTKDLIFASVTDNSSDNDIIAGKGGGSVNLLEGPPGVGKTLTAEAVAEKLQKPLYMVSAGELGTTVGALEQNLQDILEIAATWGAVLLIDEADIFLETRDKHDVVRNSMVAVFLRLLEYYQGVLFLTTNRADNLDPAFESRITLCIHYTDLDVSARKQIWTNLFKAAKLSIHNRIDVNQLAAHVLNGRQIKGIIKSARSLARFHSADLNIDHFEAVIKQKADFKSATVFKLGHGLDNHSVAGDDVVVDKKPGLIKRFWNAIWNIGPSLGQGQ